MNTEPATQPMARRKMSKLRRDPSPSELLDRLVRLENETAGLKAELAEIHKAFKVALEAYKFQIDAGNSEILEIYHDFLWPLVHKVFPGFTRTQKQIDRIVKPKSPSDSKGGSKPK